MTVFLLLCDGPNERGRRVPISRRLAVNKPLLLDNPPSRNKAKCTLPPINPVVNTISDSPVYTSSQYHQKLIRFLLRMSHVLEPLKAVTHNLPALIRQPLIAVVGTECYTSLVWYAELCRCCCNKLTSEVALRWSAAGTSIFRIQHVSSILLVRFSELVW
jgi:hypothetical protein